MITRIDMNVKGNPAEFGTIWQRRKLKSTENLALAAYMHCQCACSLDKHVDVYAA